MHFYIDLALRDSGYAIFENKQLINFGSIKYKEKFDIENYENLISHYKFLRVELEKVFLGYNIKKVVTEADTFGVRKGGYKTKELLTLVRANFIHAIYSIDKSIEVRFIRAYEWKNKLLGSSKLEKSDYEDLSKNIIAERYSKHVSNHNVRDAILIGYYLENIANY